MFKFFYDPQLFVNQNGFAAGSLDGPRRRLTIRSEPLNHGADKYARSRVHSPLRDAALS